MDKIFFLLVFLDVILSISVPKKNDFGLIFFFACCMLERKLRFLCHFCLENKETKKCSCGFARYCSVECQTKDWPQHKVKVNHQVLNNHNVATFYQECERHISFLILNVLSDSKKCPSFSAIQNYGQSLDLPKEEYFLRYQIHQKCLSKKAMKSIWGAFIMHLILISPLRPTQVRWVAPKEALTISFSGKTKECENHDPPDPTAQITIWVNLSFGDSEQWARIQSTKG